MSIAVVTNSLLSYPLLQRLKQRDDDLKIFIPEESQFLASQFNASFGEQTISLLKGKEKNEFPVKENIDWLIAFGYPFKLEGLPSNLNAVNIHFGSLPENRGADPVFWTLKQGKKLAYVAIHELSEKFDSGDILLEKGFDIIPGENYGLLNARLASMCVPMVEELIQTKPKARKQDETKAVYHPKPSLRDLIIYWDKMTAAEIESLVNASNPKFGGALTLLNGAEVRILEVIPADNSSLSEEQKSVKGGSVIHADPNSGLFVLTKDQQCLRINIVSMNEGVVSGTKLAAMGVNVGTVFGA